MTGNEAVLLASYAYDSGQSGRLSGECRISPEIEPRNVYEFSLYGLMLGACLVVVISVWRRHTLKRDNVTILAGITIATVAALLNIADAMLSTKVDYGDIPVRGSFFLVVWIFVVIVPVFSRLFQETGEAATSLLVKIATTLLIAAAVGIVVRIAFPAIIKEGIGLDGIDHLRFRPDTLILLSSAWILAAFAPPLGRHSIHRRCFYMALAPLAGFIYSYFISHVDGHAAQGISASRMAFGYALLSAAAILPVALFSEGVVGGRWKATLFASLATGVACMFAMLVGLANTWNLVISTQLALSALQGLAGGLAPVVAFLGTRSALGLEAAWSRPGAS